jgi:hypothetical protein
MEIGDTVYIVNLFTSNISECEVISEEFFRERVESCNPHYDASREYECDLFVRHVETDTVECIVPGREENIFTNQQEANDYYVEHLKYMIKSMGCTIESYRKEIDRYKKIINTCCSGIF